VSSPSKTRRYNVLFPVETLEKLERFCDGTGVSKAAFVRGAVQASLELSPVGTTTVLKKDGYDIGFRDGVEGACLFVASCEQLAVDGVGEEIANTIRRVSRRSGSAG
jgi:hypothetical protein